MSHKYCVEILAEALAPFADYAGLAVPWYLFGTSHRIYREDGYVISRFTRRRSQVDQHHKCIVQPARISRSLIGGHLFECKDGGTIVDQGGRAVTEPRSATRMDGTLRINHYLTKSIQELVARRSSRSIDTGDVPKLSLNDWIEHEKGWNEVEDCSAQRILGRMETLSQEYPEANG